VIQTRRSDSFSRSLWLSANKSSNRSKFTAHPRNP
jgi:hypothetical protein